MSILQALENNQVGYKQHQSQNIEFGFENFKLH